jgi:diguanylate cyclase (GGDEF)-like protein/PAS domain S-box-containing protein
MSQTGHFASALAPHDELAVLRTMLDHLPLGISVFDSDLQMLAVNRLLIEMLDFPVAMFEQSLPTLEELTLYNARRGDYGEGDPYQQTQDRMALARLGNAHCFRRTRPNGQVLEITGVPLPNGGFISIYTDITESQRRESALLDKTELLQTLVDNLPSGVSVFDKALQLVLMNESAIRLLGFSRALLQQHPNFEDLARWNVQRGEYGKVDPERFMANLMAKVSKPVPHRMERTRPNGTVIELRGAPMPHGGFVTVYTDVTEQKATERELRHQSEVFQTLVDNIPGGVTLFSADQRLLAFNKEFARLLDFPPSLLENTPTLESFFLYNARRGEYGEGDAEEQVQNLLARARENKAHLFKRTRPDGTILEVRGLPLADGGFVTIYTDVTEQHRAAEAIERLAHRDTLTGLANRYTLEARLDQLVADARRHERHLAVMFLDMDNFKSINDTLGHGIGDQFLVEVARRLGSTVRENDIVARLGGDEFVVVLAEVIEREDVAAVAEKVIASLREPVFLGSHELRASSSIGICFYPQDGRDRGTLMQSADIAMYHAKNAGKGVYHFFDATMVTSANTRLELERALHEAIRLQQFVLHYQPQLDASGLRVTGVEALIRWQKPSGEMVPPGDFISLAEELGLINEIGDWALRTACGALVRWRHSGLTDLNMAVNLSAIQLRHASLPQRIAQALADSGLPASALTLEITESVAMQDPHASIERLGLIRALGVRLAIDDFGTGYSSLAYLKRLPLDYLKLDQAFVQDLETDSNDAAICAATIGLAHNLGLAVVAEGVETQAQRDYLGNLGCDAFQGHFFSRALAEADAYDWLRSQHLNSTGRCETLQKACR